MQKKNNVKNLKIISIQILMQSVCKDLILSDAT